MLLFIITNNGISVIKDKNTLTISSENTKYDERIETTTKKNTIILSLEVNLLNILPIPCFDAFNLYGQLNV